MRALGVVCSIAIALASCGPKVSSYVNAHIERAKLLADACYASNHAESFATLPPGADMQPALTSLLRVGDAWELSRSLKQSLTETSVRVGRLHQLFDAIAKAPDILASLDGALDEKVLEKLRIQSGIQDLTAAESIRFSMIVRNIEVAERTRLAALVNTWESVVGRLRATEKQLETIRVGLQMFVRTAKTTLAQACTPRSAGGSDPTAWIRARAEQAVGCIQAIAELAKHLDGNVSSARKQLESLTDTLAASTDPRLDVQSAAMALPSFEAIEGKLEGFQTDAASLGTSIGSEFTELAGSLTTGIEQLDLVRNASSQVSQWIQPVVIGQRDLHAILSAIDQFRRDLVEFSRAASRGDITKLRGLIRDSSTTVFVDVFLTWVVRGLMIVDHKLDRLAGSSVWAELALMAANLLDLDRTAARGFAHLVVTWAKQAGVPVEALVSRACVQSTTAHGNLVPLFLEELIREGGNEAPIVEHIALLRAVASARLAATNEVPPPKLAISDALASAVLVGAARAQVQMAAVEAGAQLGWGEQEQLIVGLAGHLRGHTTDVDAAELQTHAIIAGKSIEELSVELHSRTLEELAKTQSALLSGLVTSTSELKERLSGFEARNQRALDAIADATKALGANIKSINGELEELDELSRWCETSSARGAKVSTDWHCVPIIGQGKPTVIVRFAVGDFKECKFTLTDAQKTAYKEFAERAKDILHRDSKLSVWVRGFASDTKPFKCREMDEPEWKDWCGALSDQATKCSDLAQLSNHDSIAKTLNSRLADQRAQTVQQAIATALQQSFAERVKIAKSSVAGAEEVAFSRAVLIVLQ